MSHCSMTTDDASRVDEYSKGRLLASLACFNNVSSPTHFFIHISQKFLGQNGWEVIQQYQPVPAVKTMEMGTKKQASTSTFSSVLSSVESRLECWRLWRMRLHKQT